jgi:hypothetical protein
MASESIRASRRSIRTTGAAAEFRIADQAGLACVLFMHGEVRTPLALLPDSPDDAELDGR